MVVLYEQRHIEQLRTHVMYVVVRSYTGTKRHVKLFLAYLRYYTHVYNKLLALLILYTRQYST